MYQKRPSNPWALLEKASAGRERERARQRERERTCVNLQMGEGFGAIALFTFLIEGMSHAHSQHWRGVFKVFPLCPHLGTIWDSPGGPPGCCLITSLHTTHIGWASKRGGEVTFKLSLPLLIIHRSEMCHVSGHSHNPPLQSSELASR